MASSMQRSWVAWLGLASALAGCTQAGERADVPRNVLLISIDTLRPDHLGCYGRGRDTSPTLDALAARGVRFDDASASAPWTLPSHASLLTGLYASHHGVKNHETRLAESVVTLAEEFQAHGLRTLAVVNTWNMGAPQFRLDQGFKHFHYVPETEPDERAQPRTRSGTRDVITQAKEFLEEEAEQPFFLFLHFYDVHTDFTPRAPYREQFVEPYEGRLNGRTNQLLQLRELGETLTSDDLGWLIQMYDAEIRQLDDALGRFLAWLDERGWLAETLVLVTSDHGEEFQEHGGLLHGRTQYQEVLRVPLLIAGPGVPAGVVVSSPVNGVDVAPTLLACMGLPSGTAHDGLDLAPLWRGEELPGRAFFGEADHTNRVDGQHVLDLERMVRRDMEKLHVNRLSGAARLFDLSDDPGELHDLAAARPERAQVLREELERYLAGAREAESIPQPTEEERRLLDELGYGGDTDE